MFNLATENPAQEYKLGFLGPIFELLFCSQSEAVKLRGWKLAKVSAALNRSI